MFKVMEEILNIGKVKIKEEVEEEEGGGVEREGSEINEKERKMMIIEEILKMDENEMRSWMCKRKIVRKSEVLLKKMKVEEDVGERDDIEKKIYEKLLNWIVKLVNKDMESKGN